MFIYELFESTRFRIATSNDVSPISKIWARSEKHQQQNITPTKNRIGR